MDETMDKDKLLEQVEMIYREIAEEDKRLCEDFLSISVEVMEKSMSNLGD
jgi:hypothetical protein